MIKKSRRLMIACEAGNCPGCGQALAADTRPLDSGDAFFYACLCGKWVYGYGYEAEYYETKAPPAWFRHTDRRLLVFMGVDTHGDLVRIVRDLKSEQVYLCVSERGLESAVTLNPDLLDNLISGLKRVKF